MTRPALLLAVSAALLGGGCSKFRDLVNPPMAEFTSPDGKWKAKFPGAPSEKSKSAFGVTFTMWMREPWGNKGGYMVGTAELPISANEPDHMVQKRLDDGVTGSVNGVGGKLQESKRIMLNGRYPGRECVATITEPKAGRYRMRMYLVGTRMYMVGVVGADDFVDTPQAQEFFESFALVGGVAPSDPAERLTTARAKPEGADTPPPAKAPPGSIHSTNGKFKARFPAAPTKGKATAGDVTFTTYSVTAEGATYAAGYADRPELDGAAAKDRQEAVDAARDAAVAELGAEAQMGKCELVVLAGRHRGWEFDATAGDRTLRARVYLVGSRLYRVTARGSDGAVRDPAVDEFFGSFQLAN